MKQGTEKQEAWKQIEPDWDGVLFNPFHPADWTNELPWRCWRHGSIIISSERPGVLDCGMPLQSSDIRFYRRGAFVVTWSSWRSSQQLASTKDPKMKQTYSKIKRSIGNLSIMFHLSTYLNQKIDEWLLYQVLIYPPGRDSSSEKAERVFMPLILPQVDGPETDHKLQAAFAPNGWQERDDWNVLTSGTKNVKGDPSSRSCSRSLMMMI